MGGSIVGVGVGIGVRVRVGVGVGVIVGVGVDVGGWMVGVGVRVEVGRRVSDSAPVPEARTQPKALTTGMSVKSSATCNCKYSIMVSPEGFGKERK